LSHLKERSAKNCLNCNAQVYGKYCHICGQENIEPKESAWHLLSHFFQDITHFDGKFFTSIKYLILKPGFLSHEYLLGRRASHLNPVRFYIFTSAFFFLIFFSLFKISIPKNVTTVDNGKEKKKVDELRSMDAKAYKAFIDDVITNDSTLKFAYDSTLYFKYLDSIAAAGVNFSFTPSKYKTRKEYDSALTHGKKHNWIERQFTYKQIELNEKYKGDAKTAFTAVLDKLLHSLPQILFITLPVFAFLLKLLYIRRKQYYYVNHAIFTIHLFVFVFIALLAVFGINKLKEVLHAGWLGYISGFIILLIFVYNYKAMRNFYQQGRAKTITKFLLLQLTNFIVVIFLFIVFFMASIFKI
jgi:hypothetical protein